MTTTVAPSRQHLSADWDDVPPEGLDYFRAKVLAPWQETIDELEQIRRQLGWRYAWEVATAGRLRDWPQKQAERTLRFCQVAERQGFDGLALVAAHEDLQALVRRFDVFASWGNS